MPSRDADSCVSCAIVCRQAHAEFVHEDELTASFVDPRQFHPGHMLVNPRAHLADVRDLDGATGAALMAAFARVTRAVGRAPRVYPGEIETSAPDVRADFARRLRAALL